ncbi:MULTISPECIES: TrbM/KikA/MpfK family conjugal transfer protein [Enterobacteriaceae]|jgi:hypothetical protein|uniref:TrbM/KikA/MpfK family conjugal transfer protein n=1 Tax=Cedecea sp. TaxID=1970739 RepID=UPI00135A42CA|nr:TrbM/KikA/MpfK family conjugal transfer protein [Scandinavium goeteborgense]
MKHTAIAAALLCAAVAVPAFAGDDADANDPCAIYLCMAGKLEGGNPAECDPMYKNFMNIKKKKHGAFLPGQTADARKTLLQKCAAADQTIINKIISKFGRLKG